MSVHMNFLELMRGYEAKITQNAKTRLNSIFKATGCGFRQR